MPFELEHTLLAKSVRPVVRTSGDQGFVEVDEEGSFAVLFTGRVLRGARAEFFYRKRVPAEGTTTGAGNPAPQPQQGGFETERRTVPLTLQVFTPDGQEFTAPQITVADLGRFRDPRGGAAGPWTYRLTGKSDLLTVDEDHLVADRTGSVSIRLTETIASESAPPLVGNAALSEGSQEFRFDLYRVGTLVADIRTTLALWRGRMRLLDPDGALVAETANASLSFQVSLQTLNKSRAADGAVRPWTLQVTNLVSGPVEARPRLTATVIGEGRVTLAALQSRIDAMLGPSGRFFEVFGENKGGQARINLRINDVASAETIDFFGLLDTVVNGIDPDKGIEANTVYTLFETAEDLGHGVRLGVGSLRVDSIEVIVGPGVQLGVAVPAVRLTIAVSGEVTIKLGRVAVADVEVRAGKLEVEVGIKASSDGTPQTVASLPDKILDVDVKTVPALVALAVAPATAAAAVAAAEGFESSVNAALVSALRRAVEKPGLASSVLMMIHGAHLNHRPFRIENGAFLFDHIAPTEPEPKPRPAYHAAIGRSFTVLGDNVRFNPLLLPDTWKADNLAKIDQVVVVMMENRSYDHLLGYRAQLNNLEEGLRQDIIEAIEGTPGAKPQDRPFKVRRLREAGFDANSLGLRTRLPTGVGHGAKDVQQQLRFQIDGPGGRRINSPKGFVDNYLPQLKTQPGQTPTQAVPNDVLGFYDERDLPVYAFLAEHYAYSENYYCSHPGPTLPNRMYSLTGDLQFDRYGFPIVENNNGDNFLLSRRPTIFDVLLRKGVSCRVYESDPSVTMLRMFARYATDTTHILPLQRFFADAAAGALPKFSMVEPRMHSHPFDDDHPPDADMHLGQHFVKAVYDALRRSAEWEKTLLIVTYDEHGGFYDHRVPPVAELMGKEALLHPGFGTPPPAAPAVPAAQASLLPIPYGVRVPTFVVSPWVMRGRGPGTVLDHCSILKTVLARFLGAEKPFLSDRVAASHSFNAFLSEAAPRLNVPPSPALGTLEQDARIGPSSRSRILTPALSRQQMRRGPVEFHDLLGRWARQLGR